MSKTAITAVIILLICAVISAFIITGAGGINLDNFSIDLPKMGDSRENSSSSTIDNNSEFDTAGIEKLEVKTIAADIRINKSNDSKIKVVVNGSVESSNKDALPEFKSYKSGNRIVVEEVHNMDFSFFSFHSNVTVEIAVPESFSKNISVTTTSGSITAEDLVAGTLEANSVSGACNLSNVSVKDIKISTASGSAKLESIKGNLQYNSISGSLNASYNEFANNIQVHTTSGSVGIDLPDEANFDITFNSVSGSFNNSFSVDESSNDRRSFKSVSQKIGNGNNRIQIDTVSGSAEIN